MTDRTKATLDRQGWLAVLAQAERGALERHAAWLAEYSFEWLRAPEIGLVMVRARIGGEGDRFNLGEATVTRCAVRHQPSRGTATAGVGYVLGRDLARCEWVARFDALLQVNVLRDLLQQEVIEPLRAATALSRAQQWARTASSTVRFYTLQSELAT